MIESGFFPSRGGDRVYSAEQFGKIMDFLVTDGVYEVYPANGVMYNADGTEAVAYQPFKVSPVTTSDAYYSPSSPSVAIGPGRAWFDHTWTHVSSPEIVPLLPPPNSDIRWDTLVLTMDKSEAVRRNYFRFIQGVEGVDNPDLTRLTGSYMHGDAVHDVPIAFVKRRALTDVPAQIRSAVGYALCPFVRSINGSRNNVWSVQHIIDAATAKIDDRINDIDFSVDEWLIKKNTEIDTQLQQAINNAAQAGIAHVDERFEQLNNGLSARIQQEITVRLEGVEQELRDKVDKAVSEKIDQLDIKSMVDKALNDEVKDRFTQLEGKIEQAEKDALDKAHPIGSYYWSKDGTKSPAELFGGTWTPIQGVFLRACGPRDTPLASGTVAQGGAASVRLTTDNMPPHKHNITDSASGSSGSNGHRHSVTISHTHSIASHSHSMSHTHALNDGGNSFLGAGTGSSWGVDCSASRTKGIVRATSGDVMFGGTSWGTMSGVSIGAASTSNTGSTSLTTGAASTSTFNTAYSYLYTTSVGNGTAFDIQPPYINSYCWRRDG